MLVLENVRSLHNVGAIFRSADAANIERIVLGPLTPAPPRHEIEKTALGATASVPWEQVSDLATYLTDRREHGYAPYALEQSASSQDLFLAAPSVPAILVVGHEREGVSPELLALCDRHFHLPMRGTSARSLNVATAAGIALYEIGRRVWYHG